MRLNLQAHSLQEIEISFEAADLFSWEFHPDIGKQEIPFLARLSIESNPLRRPGKKGEESAFQNAMKIENQIKPLFSEVLNKGPHLLERPPPTGNGGHPLRPSLPWKEEHFVNLWLTFQKSF